MDSSKTKTSINTLVWLRRDLRLHDHAALSRALSYDGTVQPVFVFDTDVLARFDDPRDRRLSFIANALMGIDKKLRERGGELLVLHGKAQEVIPKLAKALQVERVVAAEDYEPGARKRDEAVGSQVMLELVKDQLIFSPMETTREEGSPYKVFTPYYKQWLQKLEHEKTAIGKYSVSDKARYAQGALEAAQKAGLKCVTEDTPEAMLAAVGYEYGQDKLWQPQWGQKALELFMEKIDRYPVQRDFVANQGTSRISPHLRFGTISVREAAREAGDLKSVWVKELCWREFYAAILYHFPESATMEWNPHYRGTLDWSHNPQHLAAWKEGRTGYPLVDAAMRQLKREGWMHNRARMVVASFFTKHLRLDWRLGEEHFAQLLMDYDMASNVGGWQWAASTGTDAQPWFRVFNPILQSKKFDPDGAYIRYFVPELASVKGDAIHEPWKIGGVKGYPEPIVDHATARAEALAMFKRASNVGSAETSE